MSKRRGCSKESSRIGEVADHLGVSPRTIKYYEEIGLVGPESRSRDGFGLYGERGVERLERILRMKGLGYSLAAIREIPAVRDAARGADKATVPKTVPRHLKEREREVEERVRQVREDLRRDIALRERRLREPGS